jgi:ATP/maltotriose-dependent transcriptional regulator MalT
MRLELRRTRDRPEIASAVFDGYLCAAEYMLYGPMPYAEVIDLAVELQATAQRSGGLRAAAFASALGGEAAFLSGDLDRAGVSLAEARELHREVGSAGGEAHSLQRLAEVRLAQGDAEEARKLLQHALPLARGSTLSRHLLQRVFGTMVLAAPDPFEAVAVVDRAESTVGWEEDCAFCSIMLEVPASLACVQAGDLPAAHRHLGRAESSMPIWQGTAWEAAIAEVKAAISDATGDVPAARAFRQYAAERFERAGQPRDAARCRQAVAAV